jgi:hypothetical protein
MLSVGSPYPVSVREGGRLELLKDGTWHMIFAAKDLMRSEIAAWKEEKITVRFIDIDGVLFFTFAAGTHVFCDCPFNYQLCLQAHPDLNYIANMKAMLTPDKGISMHCVIVDARDNVIKVMRMFSLTNAVSHLLLGELEKQEKQSKRLFFTKAWQYSVIQKVYKKFTSKELFNISTAGCYSGQKK